MKKKIAIISMTLIVGTLLYFTGIRNSKAYYYGPLPGYTGSPYDGETCDASGCHDSHPLGSAQKWISSNVPAAGYIPNTVYTLTAKAVKVGYSSFGFEISPQSAGGNPLGSLIVTNSTTTQIATIGSIQYIEQTLYGYTGKDSLSWTFNWKAPAKGTGSVTFYGAFNCGNGNSVPTGTYVYPATLVIPENIAAGIADIENTVTSFSLFPNPARGQATISYCLNETSNVEINMYGMDGKKISNFWNGSMSQGEHKQNVGLSSDIKPGIYLVQLIANRQSTIQKIVVE